MSQTRLHGPPPAMAVKQRKCYLRDSHFGNTLKKRALTRGPRHTNRYCRVSDTRTRSRSGYFNREMERNQLLIRWYGPKNLEVHAKCKVRTIANPEWQSIERQQRKTVRKQLLGTSIEHKWDTGLIIIKQTHVAVNLQRDQTGGYYINRRGPRASCPFHVAENVWNSSSLAQ
jgi:hypothetical protein